MVAPPVGAQRGVMVAPLGLVILAALGVIGSHGEEVASCPQALDDNLAFCNAPQINLLINAGSVGTDPNCFISTQKGYAIHSAVEWYNALLFNDCYPTLTRILQWGADPNLKKGSGALNIMPLHMMIEGCLKPTPQMPKLESGLALLIEFKADPKVEDYKRRTAIELAQSLGASAKAIAILKGLPPPTPAPAAFGEPSPSAGADTGGGNSNIATFLILGALPLTICACAFAYKFCKKGSGAESDSESDVTDLSDDSYIPMQQVEKPQGPMIIMAPTTSDEEDNPDMSLKPAIPKKAGTKHAAEISKLKDAQKAKFVKFTLASGANLYQSINESGGGMRCFAEQEESCSNTENSRRMFKVRTQLGKEPILYNFVQLSLLDEGEDSDDEKVLYVSSNKYAGGNAVFCEKKNTKTNIDPVRRQFKLKPVGGDGQMVEIELLDGRCLYQSTNVVDGGHGVFAQKRGIDTNTADKRRQWKVQEL